MKKRITASALALVMALSVCVTATPISNVQAKENDAQVEEDNSQESAETIDEVFGDKKYDSINWETDFEYEIQGNNIVLRKYIGNAEVLNIPATATINGVTYKVKFNDDCSSFFFRTPYDIPRVKSISISKDIDTSNVTDMSGLFFWCENLQEVDLSGLDTSNVTDMSGMFGRCGSLTSLDLSVLDTSKVTDMSGMFGGCSSLPYLDLNGLDTSKVTDMSGMFEGCSSLPYLDLNVLDTSKVTGMSEMFSGCSSLTSLDVRGFDTSKVTDMSGMFNQCGSLTSLDVRGFDTSKVTDMSGMFTSCGSLTSLDLSGIDTSKVTDMSNMFRHCGLQEIDLSGLDTSNVTDMSEMFGWCEELSVLDVSGFNTGNVTNMSGMFMWCQKLKKLDLSSFDTSKVIDMGGMFYEDIRLESVDISGFDMSNVEFADGMFRSYWNYMNLKEIKTPTNLNIAVELPFKYVLKDDITIEYDELPMNYKTSLTLINLSKGQEMYRMYNPNTGEHLYTSDMSEISWLVEEGWFNEGVSWVSPIKENGTGNPFDTDKGIPVFRLYNPYSGEHHYTMDEAEKEGLINIGWNYEGIKWFSTKQFAIESRIPVYRLFNPHTNIGVQSHVYTTDEGERDWLISTGWNDEGIGWYGLKIE